MTCPKCQTEMRSYERNGVTVDQCNGCRGVFLDRGELERLIDAESSFYEQRGPTPPPPPQPQPPPPPQQQGYGHGGYGHHGYGKRRKKKESFLSDLLDF